MTDAAVPTSLPSGACSLESLRLGEPLAGTATHATRWLLVEQPGPWGRKAFTESRLDPALGAAITDRADALGARAQLIRRAGPGGKVACFVVDGAAATIRALRLDRAGDVLDADLDRDGEPVSSPVFFVCTNARRDACCAVLGNAVARSLHAAGFEVWETSHVGGHRFAANVLAMPHGYLFGRVDASTCADVAGAYASGLLRLAHLRGRCSLAPVAQAAEWFVRQEAGFYGVDDVVVESSAGQDVTILCAGHRWTLRVDARPAATPRIESCGATETVAPMTYELVEIDARPA